MSARIRYTNIRQYRRMLSLPSCLRGSSVVTGFSVLSLSAWTCSVRSLLVLARVQRIRMRACVDKKILCVCSMHPRAHACKVRMHACGCVWASLCVDPLLCIRVVLSESDTSASEFD
eukprot:6181334-Pleurochrysis_carterae.AAC.2